MRPSVLIFLLFLSTAVRVQAQSLEVPRELPAVVDTLEVHGLWRTRPFVVPRELPWKPGKVVTPDAWRLGVQRVWNLGIFSRVSAHLEQRGTQRVAVFELEERWTINLLLRGAAGGGVWEVLLGSYDINTLGRYLEVGGYYQRFGRYNGGELWLNQPRLFDRRLDGEIIVDDTVRPRATYADQRASVELDLIHEQRDDLHYGGRLQLMMDHSLALPGVSTETLPPFSRTVAAGAVWKLGIVNTIRIRQDGASIELRPSVSVASAGPTAAFGRLWAELLWFRMVGQRWNFAVRGQAGAMSPALDPQHFFLGGLDLIRGYPDNAIDTRFYGLINAEVRFTAFDSTWLAFQPTAFADGALARNGETPSAIGLASVGLGLRVLCPRLVHSGIRLDGALPLTPLKTPNLSFGVFQFF